MDKLVEDLSTAVEQVRKEPAGEGDLVALYGTLHGIQAYQLMYRVGSDECWSACCGRIGQNLSRCAVRIVFGLFIYVYGEAAKLGYYHASCTYTCLQILLLLGYCERNSWWKLSYVGFRVNVAQPFVLD